MENKYSTPNEKIRLWTRQHNNILQTIEEEGTYRVKQEYISQKLDTLTHYYLSVYDWYVMRAELIVKRPNGVVYPIWLSTSPDLMLQPTDDTVILELEVDKKLAVLTDSEKWGYVMNYWYVPLDDHDEKRHNEELKKYGIGDESSLYMSHKGDFYPFLKNKIIMSWDRIFQKNIEISKTTQATLWEIRKEWIINIL